MDKSRFSDRSPGKLVPTELEDRAKDWAFIPDSLPTALDFTPEVWRLLVEARAALGTLNGHGQSLRDPILLLRPLQSREAMASSRIEGTFVTPQEFLLYEMDPKEPRPGDEQTKDWLEVLNYNRALQHGCKLLNEDELPICTRLMREMHSVLMQGVRGRDKTPGDFRLLRAKIGHTARFVPPPPENVVPLMTDLENYINAEGSTIDPLIRAFLVHYQFETIHPFSDGNGRVGRLLLSLMSYHEIGLLKPWLYLSDYFDRFKDEYIQSLFDVSATGNWIGWISFCLRATIAQCNDSIRRCRLIDDMIDSYRLRVVSPSTRTHSIIDGFLKSPFVTIPNIRRRFGVDYKTAQRDVASLVQCGILRELSTARPKTYYAFELFNVAYFDD